MDASVRAMSVREAVTIVSSLALLALVTLACKTSGGGADGGTTSSPPTPGRGARQDCGGRYGTCPPGQECLMDSPTCHGATGFCGTVPPECVVVTPYCGCGSTYWSCGWPTGPWMFRGAACIPDSGRSRDAAMGP